MEARKKNVSGIEVSPVFLKIHFDAVDGDPYELNFAPLSSRDASEVSRVGRPSKVENTHSAVIWICQ